MRSLSARAKRLIGFGCDVPAPIPHEISDSLLFGFLFLVLVLVLLRRNLFGGLESRSKFSACSSRLCRKRNPNFSRILDIEFS